MQKDKSENITGLDFFLETKMKLKQILAINGQILLSWFSSEVCVGFQKSTLACNNLLILLSHIIYEI